ncbi:MAG: EI24 domain-containing protein [Cryobacterium sp.]
MSQKPVTTVLGPVRQFAAGAGFLGQGLRLWGTSPKLMLIGAIPAFLVGVVFVVGMVGLALNLPALTEAITPFAETWTEPWRTGARVGAGAVLAVVSVLILVYSYTAITLLVGAPFYERIWRTVETRLGSAPTEQSSGFIRSAVRSVADSLRLLVPAVGVGIVIVLCGLLPVVGQMVAFTLSAGFGGWLLVMELSGLAFDARGFTLRQRRETLARSRASSLGFGVSTYILFLIPGAAVFVMPAAVAGATLLSRSTLGTGRD